jgi:pimeloyl-ACP methyl ester carboxylesterase
MYPDRVVAQIFTNANGALREEWTPSDQQRSDLQVDEIRRNGRAALLRMAYHPAKAKRFPPGMREILSSDADTVDANGVALLLEQASPRLSIRDRLGELRIRTLLVNGMWEKRFQPARLSRAHPHIEIVDLEGGHSVNIECAQAFDAAVVHFLDAAAADRNVR